jgi:hypothetical protein
MTVPSHSEKPRFALYPAIALLCGMVLVAAACVMMTADHQVRGRGVRRCWKRDVFARLHPIGFFASAGSAGSRGPFADALANPGILLLLFQILVGFKDPWRCPPQMLPGTEADQMRDSIFKELEKVCRTSFQFSYVSVLFSSTTVLLR